ncbi:hypothetical protein ACFVW8_08425 [Streptomyces sp. NPDC058221]
MLSLGTGKVIFDIGSPFDSTLSGLAHREVTAIAQEVATVARPNQPTT